MSTNNLGNFPIPESKVAVVGAGAIGSVLGGYLAKNGVDVTLIARPHYVEAINKQGLVVQSVRETVTSYPKAAATLDFRPDLVLLAVKSQHTVETAVQIKHFVKGVPVVSLQNGLRNLDLLADVIEKGDIIGGVVAFDARMIEPGRVFFATRNSDYLIIGEAFQANGKRIERIRDLLSKNNVIAVRTSSDIRAALWSKLIANVGVNALMTLTDLGVEELFRHSKTRKAIAQLIREACIVCRKAHVRLESIPGMPLHTGMFAMMPVPLVNFLFKTIVSRKVKGHDVAGELRFLKDLKRGKTEIDYLNGEIVELGKKIGQPVPVNQKIVDLVHKMEKIGRTMSLEELVANL